MAAATVSSPKISPQRAKFLLLVTMRLARSQCGETSRKEPDPVSQTPVLRRGSSRRGVRVMPSAKSPEFRRRALDLIAEGEPVAQVARNLGVSESCLRRWRSQDEVDAGRVEGLTSSEKRELVELRRKNRVLEMENEILKRASAYLARENVLPK